MSTKSLVRTLWNIHVYVYKEFSSSRNGGSCYLNQTGFSCACPTGFAGTCCELTMSVINPCYVNPCLNGGTCQIVDINTRRCVCPNGYYGAQCEQRLCDPNPCLYGGVCLPYLNGFQCQCPAQYTGRCCELLLITTAAPNPCSSNPCQNGGTCSATSATSKFWYKIHTRMVIFHSQLCFSICVYMFAELLRSLLWSS